MSLILTILIFSAYSCVALADESFPKVIAQAVGLKGGTKPHGVILKTDAELSKFLDLPVPDAHTKIKQVLKVNEINFANHMILVIQGGECRSGGFKVAFEKLEIKGATLQVLWKLQGPPADAFVTQALTYPSLVLLLEKHKGEITFKQIIDIKK
ncbi:MAG: protease complex subunit PrcB family protein [Gemmataceae bacterium]|jgi:PrcB C-terminal|nr:protease complex subunit PrcB family protein [Gemmataceae bacterium]